VSNQSKSETIVKLFRAGASDYIVKPFIREELIARLKVHLKAEKLNRKLVGHVHELKRLSKLQNDFLSITSHDLRSPLCGMLGFANLLAEDETLRAHHRKIAGYIKQSGDFLMNMINDILDLGRIQSEGNTLSMKPVPIVELLESSSNTVRHMATPKEIRVELHNHCERNPFISGDRKSITRIFNNILSNAIKFTPDGGRIEQRVTLVSPNRVQITIADNGIGIPSKQIPGLFDRFSRYTRTGTNGEKGTGLGLSITKELVTLHDGTIEVSSEEQKGACFKLYFPTIPPPDKKETFQRTNRVGLAENRAQILLVEDNATSIRLVKSILDQNSCETLYAKNGKEALLFFSEKLRRTSPLERDIDLIFLELDSAKIDGFEVAREIRNREKRFGISPTPIIGITSEHSRESWEKRGEVGISGSLAPPINKQRLNEMIQRYIFIGHE
jgi:signal transduction histidine kinase